MAMQHVRVGGMTRMPHFISTRFFSINSQNDDGEEKGSEGFTLKELLLEVRDDLKAFKNGVDGKFVDLKIYVDGKFLDIFKEISAIKIDLGYIKGGLAIVSICFAVMGLTIFILTVLWELSKSVGEVVIQSSGGLSKNQIENMVRDAVRHAAENVEKKLAIEAINHAKSVLHDTESKMAEYANQLNEEECVKDLCESLKQQLANRDVIKAADEVRKRTIELVCINILFFWKLGLYLKGSQ